MQVTRTPRRRSALAAVFLLPFLGGCDTPHTAVVLDNDYSPNDPRPLVVYDGFWQAVEFQSPVQPGSSSDPQSTAAASPNTAYVLLAPGWDSMSNAAPSSYVLLQSRQGFEVHFDDTLHIPVDDATFAGNCAAGSPLSQAQADFLTQIVFQSEFAALGYDAPTCTVTSGR